MRGPVFLILFATLMGLATAQEQPTNVTAVAPAKKAKHFQFLTVIKFPNAPCIGGQSRNGTCYTSDECLNKDGVSSGACANGYGVCCVFTLACGKTSSENCTYLTLGATTTTPTQAVCTYTICKCNPNICRFRLDLMMFTINGPVTGTNTVGNAADSNGGAIGDCAVDFFAVSSPGSRGSPVICGANSGQHLFVDASNMCNNAVFNFGAAAFSRQYDIKITQYSCQDDMGGPPDCLQYYTGNVGTLQSFNFVTKNNAVSSTATHLSSQCYSICFRRNLNKCAICFFPTINIANPTSFGLSISPNAAAQAATDTFCDTDFLIIPNGFNAVPPLVPNVNVVNGPSRFCGRYLNAMNGALGVTNASVCTTMRPFKVIFQTDANEVTIAITMANMNEQSNVPGGIVGFQLSFQQFSC